MNADKTSLIRLLNSAKFSKLDGSVSTRLHSATSQKTVNFILINLVRNINDTILHYGIFLILLLGFLFTNTFNLFYFLNVSDEVSTKQQLKL